MVQSNVLCQHDIDCVKHLCNGYLVISLWLSARSPRPRIKLDEIRGPLLYFECFEHAAFLFAVKCVANEDNCYMWGEEPNCNWPPTRNDCPFTCGLCEPPCDGMKCQNGGTLDPVACTCSCLALYSGIYCEIRKYATMCNLHGEFTRPSKTPMQTYLMAWLLMKVCPSQIPMQSYFMAWLIMKVLPSKAYLMEWLLWKVCPSKITK